MEKSYPAQKDTSFFDRVNSILDTLIYCLIAIGIYGTYSESNAEAPFYSDEAEEIMQLALKYDIKFPKVYLCQVIIETNRFQSKVYLDHNNPQGMHLHNRGLCENTGNNRRESDGTFCHYANLSTAVQDYKIWQAVRFREYYNKFGTLPKSDREYIDFLDKYVLGTSCCYRYAAAKHYNKTLKRLLTEYEKSN